MGKSYKQLSIEERTLIQTQFSIGMKPAEIAEGLKRSASTLSRELRRNDWVRAKTQRSRGDRWCPVATAQQWFIYAPTPVGSSRGLRSACAQELHCGITLLTI